MSPDFQQDFIVQTDAPERGVGAALNQLDVHRDDRPVAYYSHKLLPREERYFTVEKECNARCPEFPPLSYGSEIPHPNRPSIT